VAGMPCSRKARCDIRVAASENVFVPQGIAGIQTSPPYVRVLERPGLWIIEPTQS
jgi:hypothetical protein